LAKNKNKAKSAPSNSKASDEKPEKQRETMMEFIGSMATVLVSGLFIITFILQAFEIPSASMKNTLLVGDHLFVDRVSLAPKTKWMGPLLPYGTIHRGDIIVFISPAQPGLYLVKRVRGLPGDKIHLKDGKLYVNGELQNEPFVIRDSSRANDAYRDYRDNFPNAQMPPPEAMQQIPEYWRMTMGSHVQDGDFVVPPDHYFGMGDNRDDSLDSRYWGPVPKENLIGRPMFIYWSFDTPESQYPTASNEIDFGTRLKNIAYTIFHFLTKTRWNRTLNMVR
jgi:signal peptidase I